MFATTGKIVLECVVTEDAIARGATVLLQPGSFLPVPLIFRCSGFGRQLHWNLVVFNSTRVGGSPGLAHL